jgi:hypothetical protein
MQARGAFRVETVEAFIDGGMAARSGADDGGGSLGQFVLQHKPGLLDGLPRGNHGELRDPVEQQQLRLFKMCFRLEALHFADQLAGGLGGGSECRWRETRPARDQRIPIIFGGLSDRRDNAKAGDDDSVQADFAFAATS